ncbi:MAG: hypothetical protein U5L06_06250 [Rhodovibrio sp.]|nr:hypothetical protein [Rhodovibrio sp.]
MPSGARRCSNCDHSRWHARLHDHLSLVRNSAKALRAHSGVGLLLKRRAPVHLLAVDPERQAELVTVPLGQVVGLEFKLPVEVVDDLFDVACFVRVRDEDLIGRLGDTRFDEPAVGIGAILVGCLCDGLPATVPLELLDRRLARLQDVGRLAGAQPEQRLFEIKMRQGHLGDGRVQLLDPCPQDFAARAPTFLGREALDHGGLVGGDRAVLEVVDLGRIHDRGEQPQIGLADVLVQLGSEILKTDMPATLRKFTKFTISEKRERHKPGAATAVEYACNPRNPADTRACGPAVYRRLRHRSARTGDADRPDPVGPAQSLFANDFYSRLQQALAGRGEGVFQTGCPFDQGQELSETHKLLSGVFQNAGVYVTVVPTYTGGFMALTWGANGLELGSADTGAVRRAVAQSGIQSDYYNADMHAAAFALPEWMKRLIG